MHVPYLIKSVIGEPGAAGFFGEKGPISRGEAGIIGQKGEPGLIITRTEGESYSYSEIQIRDICSSVIKGKSNIFYESVCYPLMIIFFCFLCRTISRNFC